jgi:hypothetical protein
MHLPLTRLRDQLEKRSRRNALTPTKQTIAGTELARSPVVQQGDESFSQDDKNLPVSVDGTMLKLLSRPLKRAVSTPVTPTSIFLQSPDSPTRLIYKVEPRSNIGGGFYNFQQDLMLDLIRYDKKFHDLLLKFAENEWSSETILFFDALSEYKNASEQDQCHLAKQLYNKFIKENSKTQINIGSELRSGMDQIMTSENSKLSPELLEQLETAAAVCLVDIFTRFQASNLYKELQNT